MMEEIGFRVKMINVLLCGWGNVTPPTPLELCMRRVNGSGWVSAKDENEENDIDRCFLDPGLDWGVNDKWFAKHPPLGSIWFGLMINVFLDKHLGLVWLGEIKSFLTH